jgi:hypothetical protein
MQPIMMMKTMAKIRMVEMEKYMSIYTINYSCFTTAFKGDEANLKKDSKKKPGSNIGQGKNKNNLARGRRPNLKNKNRPGIAGWGNAGKGGKTPKLASIFEQVKNIN